MTACKELATLLGTGEPASPALEAHARECAPCARRVAGFARLDALLRSEPPAPAPLDLTRAVMAGVAQRRARERARALRQLAGLLGAAALVAACGVGLFELAGPLVPATRVPAIGVEVAEPVRTFMDSPTSAWVGLVETLRSGAAALWSLGSGPAGLTGALPPLPVFLPLLLLPLLLLANRSVSRGAVSGHVLARIS